MHNIWVACDWHLFNREVEPRHPFRSTRNIGKLGDHYADMIQDDDLFIYLGDLCDPEVTDKEALTTIIKSIPGYKVLCMGNHDNQDIVYYYDIGFDKVCDVLRIHNLLFSHKPIRVAPDELNIHGHLHTEKLSSLDYQHINAYASNYNRDDQPILLDDLIDSAMIQDPEVINDTKSLNQIKEKFEKYTSIVSGEKYRDIYDLSDKISLSPVDESVKSTNDYVMRNLFFISKDGDYDETIVQPRIPDNYMTQNGFEDSKTPRVCFSTSIDGCLMGLGQNITNKEFYVYHPVGKHKVITPTEEQVPDVKITKERWICEPVELICIGKIKAIDVNGPHDDGIPYRYGKNKEHEARLYSWGYKWIEKFNESIQPSIVSLSASVEEEEPVQKRRQRPIDEILFPDVDSTRYFEADDDAANKREDGANYGDDRPVHKVIHKNDVVADGQANLDEASKYVTKKKTGSFEHVVIHYDKLNPNFVKEFGETEVEMFSKDILDNYARINPEQLNRERIVAVKKAEDLIDYFEEVVDNFDAEYTDAYNGSIETFGDILRTVKRKHNSASEYKDAFANLIPLNLDEDQFVAFIKSRIKEMDYVEAMLSNMLRSNIDLYRIALAEIDYLESTSDDKTHLKALKKYIDEHESEFIKKSTGSSKTIVYDYSKLHRGIVIVDKNIYNNPDEKKYVKPSRMLIRAATHDVIILSHGTPNEDGRFTFDPIDYEGRTFTDVDSIVKYINKDGIKKIAIYACNVNRIIFDNADVNFKQTEYASIATVLESAIPNTLTEVHNLLKGWNAKIEKRIKSITKLEQKVYRVLGSKERILWPKFVYFYAKSNDFIEVKQFRPENTNEFNEIAQDSFELLFNMYRQLLFFAKSATNIYSDVFSGTVSESGGYYWTLKPSAGMMLIQRDGITPVTTKYHYHSIGECINDASLYLQLNLANCNCKPSLIIYENTETGDGELVKQISYKELIDQTGNQDNDVSVINSPTVYFTRLITPESLKEIFKLICPNFNDNNDNVMVKISSGEMGNTHYLHPELIGELVELVNGTICDSVTAYEGERDTKEKQIDTLKAHGFEKIGKIDVLDGNGERSIDIPDGLILKTVRIGVGCFNYKFHLILSHFKGHPMAGYGGAIKNVAIGCASRSGKSQIHTYGQSSDITVGFLDNYDQTSFLKAMADAANVFIKTMQINGPVLYINVANNLSVDCDCITQPEKPTMADIGIFASWDPVAVDSACIDAVYYAKDGQDLIERIESKHGTDLLDYAEKLGMGSRSYHLVDLDKKINESSSKVYNSTSDIGPMDREEKEKVAEKYGLRAVGQELPSKEEERRKTPEQRYEERNKKRNAALKKARKAKKRKAFVRKLKSHLPGVKNEDVELIRESDSVVDTSDVNIPDGVEHSPLYGDKKDFFYNYDYPKDANAYAERMKLEEASVKTIDEDPLTKEELAKYGIRDLYTFQRWMKNNVRYKNMTNLMTPREVLEQKKGSCHDQVVLELAVLKTLGYHPTAYFVLEHDNKPSGSQGGETHSYVVVKDNGKQYWFENAWSRYAGLHAVTDPKFIKKMHEERSWGDSNKFSELEVVRFAGEPGDSLQELVDHCFNDKQEINENSIRDTYQFELIEDIKFFDKLDESANKSKKLYPVYIMLVHSGTTVSNAIKFVSKSKFSHASISFDSSLDHMYSFARKDPSNPFMGGFRYESIGKGFYDKKEIPYALYVVPCTEQQIKKMKKRLDYFIKNESKFQFDFAGLVKNYLGIVDNPEYRWFCSRFVADILNAGAPKNKPYVAEPSLQDPDDFMRDEYATYVIGGDNLMRYNRSLVDKRTCKIIREEEMARSVKNESAIYDMDWNNPYAEQVLDYQLSCMDESIVHDFMNYLKSYKLKFDNDGNIIIRRREYDQLDAHFRASVKLIKASEKAGDWETVKAELAKLYYMSGLIYEQCDRKQSKKSTPHVREDLMDLRSVILNVFQQHLKTVMNHDPKFNFNAYYETTKYSRDTTIPKAVLTSLGKTMITLLS